MHQLFNRGTHRARSLSHVRRQQGWPSAASCTLCAKRQQTTQVADALVSDPCLDRPAWQRGPAQCGEMQPRLTVEKPQVLVRADPLSADRSPCNRNPGGRKSHRRSLPKRGLCEYAMEDRLKPSASLTGRIVGLRRQFLSFKDSQISQEHVPAVFTQSLHKSG